MPNAALREAIERVGGIGALGRRLGTSRQAVAQWERAPASRVLEIERVSGVPRFRLRPDLYPELDNWLELGDQAAVAAHQRTDVVVDAHQHGPRNFDAGSEAAPDEAPSLMHMLTRKDLPGGLEKARPETGIEKRLDESFSLVSDRLEQVHKGLEEMLHVATSVGDLKRVLSTTQSRGAWGEAQLRTLLERTLTREQFSTHVEMRLDSGRIADCVIRLPGRGEDGPALLVIEMKTFPNEDYDRLVTAQGSGLPADIDKAGAMLERTIRLQAQQLCEYVQPPHTTDFAILYLPTERLAAEVIRRPGLVTDLQDKYRVMVQGPATLAALLISLEIGWTIEGRSSEVSMVLEAAKAELEKYGPVWKRFGKKLDTARKQLDTARKSIEDALARIPSAPN